MEEQYRNELVAQEKLLNLYKVLLILSEYLDMIISCFHHHPQSVILDHPQSVILNRSSSVSHCRCLQVVVTGTMLHLK